MGVPAISTFENLPKEWNHGFLTWYQFGDAHSPPHLQNYYICYLSALALPFNFNFKLKRR